MAQGSSPVFLLSNPLTRRMENPRPRVSSCDWWAGLGLSVTATQNIEDIETEWRELEAQGIQSPGQSIDFIKAWTKRFDIPKHEQLYVTGSARGRLVALMPLVRKRAMGVNILSWFAGTHVGCGAPLIDKKVFGELDADARGKIWLQMRRGMFGADLLLLNAVPCFEDDDFFAELGKSVGTETLYRSEYESWELCERGQRTRTRRKHDKQQGAKLAAMGKVSFEVLGAKDDFEEALDTLFEQKAVRFKQWGIEDPFADEKVRQFYGDMFRGDTGLTGRLHVLRLDNEIVAVRYNLVHGQHNFALISSMSDRSELHPGSPGKQNILRAMQAVFEEGNTLCDMGEGYSDEKRHWCNVKIPLRTHYIALSRRGELVGKLHRLKEQARRKIKNNENLFKLFKAARAVKGAG